MNIYNLLSETETYNTHYLNRYIKFITSFRNQTKIKYETELHHIVPKCINPEYSNLKKNSWNKVHLTYRQHFISHWLLWKSFPNNTKLAYAFWAMQHQSNEFQNRDSKLNSNTYTELKREACLHISKSRKGANLSQEIRNKLKKVASTSEARINNSWRQLSYKENYLRFKNFSEFESEVISIAESCKYIPILISQKLNVTESGVKFVLSLNNLPIIKDQKLTKLIKNYGTKFESYEDYETQIINLHDKGYSRNEISKNLGINDWGINVVLKKHNITPNIVKTGPKSIIPL